MGELYYQVKLSKVYDDSFLISPYYTWLIISFIEKVKNSFMRNISLKINFRDILFGSAFFLYIFEQLIISSYYSTIFPSWFFELILFIAIGICLLKIILFDLQFTKRRLVFYFIVFAIILLTFLTSKRQALILQIIFILSSYKIDLKRVLLYDLIAQIFCDIVIILSASFGIVENAYYPGRGYGLGFMYYSYLGLSLYAITCIYIILRSLNGKSASYFEIILLLLANYTVYITCGSKTPYYLAVAFLIGYIIICKLHIITFYSKIWKTIATIIIPIIYGGISILIWMYAKGFFDMYLLSEWRTMILRIRYTFNGIVEYGIHLLGQEYSMEQGYYLDCGYVFVLIVYGVLFTIGLTLLYIFLFRYLYSTKNQVLYLWMLICLVGCISTNFLLNVIHNPLLFLIPNIISKRKTTIFKKNLGNKNQIIKHYLHNNFGRLQ